MRHARESIQLRLNRFGRLRTRFDAVRGMTNGLAFSLFFVWILVVLDSTRWLADSARWSLIIAGYVSALILAWRSGIGAVFRSWFLPNDRENLARDVEKRCSHFQESLLACVGLRKDDGSVKNGSEVFLMQNRAADG